jgi:GntR family transcriptional regulator
VTGLTLKLDWQHLKPEESSPTPLYIQVAAKLASAIREEQWQADQALPSERVIAETLEISRVTARKAFDLLIQQGLVRRLPGSGTYVNPLQEQPLSRLTSFTEFLKERGLTPSSAWLAREIVQPSADEAMKLNLFNHAKVARLLRQRLANGVVIALEKSTLPAAVVPDPKQVDLSLYAYLDARRHSIVRATQHIRAINAPEDIARLVGIKTHDAMLHITRLGFDVMQQPIELTITWCLSGYYDFVAELKR